MPNVPTNPSQQYGANTSPSKKEYTSDEILKNFIAVNEELKQKGYTYYQLPSMQVSQIWLDGKLTTYYPDLPNIVYPSTEGPKGSITDYKNPNFDEALLRKYTDAKSLSDQYQDRVSREVRSAIANASDPSKVSVATVTAQVNSSIDRIGGGRGITLNPNNPQYNASSLKISNELRRANAPSNKYGAPLSINTDSLSIEAVRNNDADNIVALRKVWGAQPAPADTGLDPRSDEYQYLSYKQGENYKERNSAGAYKSKTLAATVAEKEAALKTAWADFKAVNDELKAKGYSYYEVSDGVYGTVIARNDSKFYVESLKKIDGPKGSLNTLYSRYPDGRYFNPIADPNSPQFDKSLSDLNIKANQKGSPGLIVGSSGLVTSFQSLKDAEDRLLAKGVDLVKLEQDNPYSVGTADNDQLVTFGAKAPTGQTNLEKASEIANQQNNNLLSGANNNTGPNNPSAVSSPSTVAENEAALKTAWANFKSVNDELKAKGYSYQEAKDGMYGTAVGLTVPNNDIFKNVEGPKGNIRSVSSVDESLNDLYIRARTGSKALWPASASLAQAQSFQEIQDNPAGILAGTNNQVATFGAVPAIDQTNLERASELANQNSVMPLSAGNNTAPDYGTDEYKYLQALQESQHVGFSSPKIEDTTTGLAGAWSQFKSDNEKLKAEGYDYQEVKPGFYGKPVVSTDSFLTRVSGPNGDIVSATGSLSSELKDIRVRAKGPATLYDASQQFSADQKVDELSKVLIAKGVDVAKLEQDNSFAAGAGNNTGLGLDPATDEFKYLFAKKTVDLMNRDPYGTQLGDPKTELDKAWANFKAVNDELKAKGYTYIEAKDGAYGTVLKFDEKTTPKSDSPYKPTINGPNGTIDELGAYKPGTMEFADPRMDVNSAQYDKALADLYKKSTASNTYLGGQLGLASNTLLASEELKTIADRLIAKGVDLVKLEQDNPQGMLAGTMDNPVVTFGANAAKNVLGVPDRQRGGGAGGNLMQTNATNQQQIYDPMALAQQQIAASIASGKDKLDAQNKAIAAGTWKPSDGYYFTTNYAPPYSIAFDPTGKMKDYVPVGDNDWLKAHGYTYVTADGALVFGPKGNMPGFETDQSKKGEAQLINEQKWAELGVSLSGMPDLYGNPKYGSDVENMTWSQQATKIISDPINNPKNKPGLVDTSWLKPNGLTLEQAQIKAAALVNPVDGKPKPGVTQEMIAQAAKDVIISSGKLKVVNGMIVNTTNLITSDPMQSDMLPSPEWLKKMGYVVGTGGVDDVLGADGKMYSVQFPTEIAKAKNQPAATAAQTAAAAAIAGNTPAPIDRKKENELKAIWQTAINSASDIDSSTGAAEIAKRNQAMLTAESNYKNELARNDGLFQSAMVTAQNALLPAGGAVVNPSTNQALAKAGVTFAGQTLEGQEWTNNATKILADPWNHPKNKPGLVDTSWLKPNGMTFEQALAAHAALVNTTTGEPKPGVTPAMLSKALVDLRLAGAFEGGGFGTAGLRIEDGMIISGGQLPNAQNSLPSPEWLKSMGYSPGYYYKKPDPQGLGGEYDTQLGADGQIWTAVPPSVLAAMPTTQPALQSATVPAMSAGVVASSVTQTEPANPDYNPALVHAELNPTGSIQKQMELNAYFHSPNPDIQASLISELNPTGSLKKQADLNNYFASLAKTAPGAPTAVATTTYSTLPHNELNKTTDKTGNSTMNRPSTIASTTSTQPASWSPYNAPVAASGIIATDQNLAPATITLTDKNGVSRTAAINSPEAIHVGSGGTWQDLDTVSAIYSRGNATEIANWERFSGSKPPAGGYTASNSADPYTPASTVAYTTDN